MDFGTDSRILLGDYYKVLRNKCSVLANFHVERPLVEGGGGLLELLRAALGQVALEPGPLPDHVRGHVRALDQVFVQLLIGVEVGTSLARRHSKLLGKSMRKGNARLETSLI